VAHLDVLFSIVGEFGPVLRHRRKGIDQATIDRDQSGKGRECLCAGEEVDDCVLPPRDGLRSVSVPAPDVDDDLAVDVKGDRGAEFLAFGELVGQRVGDLREAGVAITVHGVVHPAIMRRAEEFLGLDG
jgi:hypothetical protein